MSNWKTAYRSFYYENAPEPDDIMLPPDKTALLVIDIQNTYLETPEDDAEHDRWKPFFQRMNQDELHEQELKIINMIYCHVLKLEDVAEILST